MLSDGLMSLLRLMADGEFHSGEELGQALGVSRAAVWKKLQPLEKLNIRVQRTKGMGYRIEGGLNLLDKATLLRAFSDTAIGEKLEVYSQIDSTNVHLMKCAGKEEDFAGRVCLAEWQSAGRGRRGRGWVSPFAKNLYLSMGWRFEQGIAAVEGLSLAIGVAVCDALSQFSVNDVRLKWPNDLLLNDKKLGGILIELAGDPSGRCDVVIGLGLNVHMTSSSVELDQPWTSLMEAGYRDIDRTQLAVEVVRRLLVLLEGYETAGFEAYQSAWNQLSAHLGHKVTLLTPRNRVEGVMEGVALNGGVILNIDGEQVVHTGGEISLRALT